MNKTKIVLEKVLKEIKPSSELIKQANKFIKELNKELEKEKIKAKAVLGGSLAKNTFLKNDYDADIFVKFNKKYKGQNISQLLERVIAKKYEYERVKGSRDYFHIQQKTTYEIVPVLDVRNIKDADNVIDMSPMHVAYFKEKGEGLEDEVRLLKKFMKAARVYGAESYIQGFSGHVVDLLLIKYKSFMNTLKATKTWKTPVVIDIEKKLKNPLMELDKSKTQGPLIIIDPVQENRNAAAAVEKECFNIFVEKAQEFLKEPSEEFFKRKTAKEIINKQKNNNIYEITIKPLKNSEDIAGAKVLKIIQYIKQEIKEKDFEIEKYEWDFGWEAKAYFVFKKENIEPKKTIRGPPISEIKHKDAFKKKHKETFTKDNYEHAIITREYTNVQTLLNKLIKNTYIKSRCQAIKIEKIK